MVNMIKQLVGSDHRQFVNVIFGHVELSIGGEISVEAEISFALCPFSVGQGDEIRKSYSIFSSLVHEIQRNKFILNL